MVGRDSGLWLDCVLLSVSLSVVSVAVHFCCCDTMCCDKKQPGDKGLLLAHSSSPTLWGLRELITGTVGQSAVHACPLTHI